MTFRGVVARRIALAAFALAAATVLAACSAAARQDGSGLDGTARAAGTAGSIGPAGPVTAVAHPATPPPAAPSVSAVSHAPVAAPNPCAHNTAHRLVKVSLTAQHLWLCSKHTIAYGTPITSGVNTADTRTPTGHFHIQGVYRNTVLTLNTGKTYDVKYWIPFDAPLFGFHDSSWQEFPYGSPKYRSDGSHGCVHMPLKAIAHMAKWIDIGTDVSIH